MDEVRRDATRALGVEHDRFALDARQTADARADRDAGTPALFECHFGQPGVFQSLTRGVDAIDDERIDLALDLVIDALARIEAIFVVGRFHLARDAAHLIRRVEARDRARARLAGEDIRPGRFNIRPQGGDQA